MSDSPDPHTGLARQTLLAELEAAVEDHLIWLSQWHRRLFFSDPVDAGDISWDPGALCRFGSWYARNKHRAVINQPAVRALAAHHETLHDSAEALATLMRQGKPVSRDRYAEMLGGFQHFINQARRLEKAFSAAAADLDPLTGLYNRNALYRNIAIEQARAARSGQSLCLGMADLDHFKKVNDTYGHHVGDIVLATAAERFTSHLRPFDTLYRFGGEEFLFTLPEADPETGADILDRLRRALSDTEIDIGEAEKLRVTASFGVSPLTDDDDVMTIINRADAALYHAKETGRNQVKIWTAETPMPSAES
ncbi:MAG: diguanylate cyclase [Magnetospiraceae bacterium]